MHTRRLEWWFFMTFCAAVCVVVLTGCRSGRGTSVEELSNAEKRALQFLSIDVMAWIRSGRDYLLSVQLKDGGWLETTRPPDGVSYAQRISTAGWATEALLLTRD